MALIQSNFSDPDPATDSDTLFHIETVPITRQTFNRLRPQQWLNDEIINSFRLLLHQRDEARSATTGEPRSYIYSSFFITKLIDNGEYSFQQVRRWHTRVPGGNFFRLARIIIPINQGNNHWACMEILPRCRLIIYHDSLRSSGLEFRDHIYQYLKDIYRDLNPTSRLVWAGRWTYLQGNPGGTPQQDNGYDCGVFTCAFMDCLMRGHPLEFTQQQLEGYRNHIAISLLHQQAPPWDQPFLNNPSPYPPITTPHNNPSPPAPTQPHIFQDHDRHVYT
jgi:sentrin-specific protease 1